MFFPEVFGLVNDTIQHNYKQYRLCNYIFLLEMIEFNKIFCDLHPNELISNYCAHEQCNIGLCATCICSHTETHLQKRTAPDYQNIRSTYSQMQDNLRSRISALQHEKTRINLLIENIHNKRRNMTEIVSQARNETLDFVNRFFDAKEKEVLRKIEADEKKLGLHNQNRMETLMNMISRDVNSLFAAAQELNSQNFLENFNRIRTQVVANSLQTQRQISEELDKNENYEVTLSINPIYINDIKSGLEKSISMVYDERTTSKTLTTDRDIRDSIIRNSRVNANSNPNENSGVNTFKRTSQSLPRPVMNHPSRCTSTLIENVPYFLKPAPSTPKMQPSHQNHHQSFTFKPEPYIVNNSVPVQNLRPSQNQGFRPSQNQGSVRVNSSEKNMRDNMQNKHPLTQSYMDVSSFSHLHAPQHIDAGKKIKKSGLTVLRAVDNQKI